jgi:hypothetical protein
MGRGNVRVEEERMKEEGVARGRAAVKDDLMMEGDMTTSYYFNVV